MYHVTRSGEFIARPKRRQAAALQKFSIFEKDTEIMNARNHLTRNGRRAATIASMLITLSLILSWLPGTRVSVGSNAAAASTEPTAQSGKKPNILVIFGDDIGVANVSAYTQGLVGYRTPNIDRIAHEGMMFTDYYAEQSCTAGRSAFITGIATLRTGLSKVGSPGATLGLQAKDPTIAELLKPLGYATGQFGKNHLGDRNEFLPTVHGFDEFFGNLYHLRSEERRVG